jgi:DNA-directed RNA polymerase specialized sigma subunit
MQNNKINSILGDVPGPFSAPKQPQDFDAAFSAWRAGRTPETSAALIKTVQPIIDTAVSSYAGQASPNIKSRARLLALDALDTFDPAQGKVKSHLLSRLQRLRRVSAQEQNIIKIPEQVGLDYAKLRRSEGELHDQLGRDASDEEIADFTGLSARRIRKIRAFNQPVSEGMTQRVNEEGQEGGDVQSTLPNGRQQIDPWLDFIYDDLSATDRVIMDMLLGRNGRKRASTQDIAARLNLTAGAVSQRAAKIQKLIDKRYEHNF